MIHKLHTKRFQLVPTYTKLQVIVCGNINKIEQFVRRRKYNISHESDLFDVHDFSGVVIEATLPQEPTPDIIMMLENFDPSLIAHEAIHVSWILNQSAGGLFNYETQETQAYLVDYIMNQVLKMSK